MAASFQGMNDPVVIREVTMKVITGHDGGYHPIYEEITLYFMSDGTVKWEV